MAVIWVAPLATKFPGRRGGILGFSFAGYVRWPLRAPAPL